MQMVFQPPLGSHNGRREQDEDFNLGRAEGRLVAGWGKETVGLRDVSRSDHVVSRLSAGTLSWESGPLFAINKTLREISHMWEPGCFLLKMSESSSFKKWSLSRTSCWWSTFHSITYPPHINPRPQQQPPFAKHPQRVCQPSIAWNPSDWHTVVFLFVMRPPVLKCCFFLFFQLCPDWWSRLCKLHSLPL